MKVLLTKDVKGLGRRMETKDVSDGYGRNFLIARKLAVLLNDTTAAAQTSWAKQLTEEKIRKLSCVKKLQQEVFQFIVKTDARGSVFGGVGKEDIRQALVARGYDVVVMLKKSIKSLGTHEIILDLRGGVSTTIKIVVMPSQLPLR